MSHLSALELDALALGAHDDVTRANMHLDECARCRADRDAAAALRAQFSYPPLPKRRRSWQWLAIPVLAIVIALIIWPRHEAVLGIKGGATWRVLAKRTDSTFMVRDEQELAAGDRIRFVVTPNGARYLIVASIDGAGNPSIYFPFDGAASGRIDGARFELPGSIVLDAAPGPERVFAILSDEPLTADVVKQHLMSIRGAIRETTHLDLPSREQLTLVFEKTP